MTERARELVNAINTDTALQTKMQAASTPAERKQVVEDAGYGDVSSADAHAAATGMQSGELSDAQLGAASGAGGFGISFGGAGISFDGLW